MSKNGQVRDFHAETNLRISSRLGSPAWGKLLGTSPSLAPLGQDRDRGVCFSADVLPWRYSVIEAACTAILRRPAGASFSMLAGLPFREMVLYCRSFFTADRCTVLVRSDFYCALSLPPHACPSSQWPWALVLCERRPGSSFRQHAARWSFELLWGPSVSSFPAPWDFSSANGRRPSSRLAPKRRIGGSGTSASSHACENCCFLDDAAVYFVPFFLSLALMSLWTLCSLLLRHSLCRVPLPGRHFLRLCSSAPVHSVQAWDVSTAGSIRPPVLRWQPVRSRHKQVRPRHNTYNKLARSVIFFLGFSSLPMCVWAAPKEYISAVQQISRILMHVPEPFSAIGTVQTDECSASFRELVADAACQDDTPAVTPKHCVVLQAGFPTQHILVYEDVPCSEQSFLRGASELLDNNKSDHVLHPTEPQIATNLASLVAAPDWIHNSDKTVYVLDFSFWNGPVYAVIDWRYITLAALAPEARRHAPVPWQVAYGRQGSLLQPGASVFAAPGDVFRFFPKSQPGVPRPAFTQLLADAAMWDSNPSYIPRETASCAWLALRSHVIRTPVYAGTSRDELTFLAAESFHTDAQDLHFGFPDEYSPLQDIVYQGKLLRGVLAAEPRSCSGARLGVFVFVDSRLLGATPSFRYCPAGWVDLAYFTAYLALPTPNGYRLEATGVPFADGQVQVTDQCTLQLRYVPCDPAGCATPPAPAGSGLADFGLSPGARPPTVNKTTGEPQRHSRDSPAPPDPEDVLAVDVPHSPVLLLQQCHFLVFTVDFRPEQVTLELPVPCTLEHALQLVSESRSADIAVYFEDLTPACPQPDESFGALLASPEWPFAGSLVMIDARVIDGRLFAFIIRGNLNRSSLLLQVQIEDRPDIQVYLRGQVMDGTTWYEFHDGELISIRTLEQPLTPAKYLTEMLQDEYDWCEFCPTFDGPLFPAFRILSDGGQHTIHANVDLVHSFADFRTLACGILRYTAENPVFCSSQPRVTDLAFLGQSFKAILVATERVIRLPTPPGRLSLYTPIVFLDCRRIFQGFHWVSAERGWLDLDLLLASYQDSAPAGYCPNVRGADTELRFGRPYLRVSFGTLLTVTFVAASDVSDDSSDPSSDPMTDGEQETEDEHHQPEPDRCESASLPDSIHESPRPRSRSPPPHRRACIGQPSAHDSAPAFVCSVKCPKIPSPKIRLTLQAAWDCLVDLWDDFATWTVALHEPALAAPSQYVIRALEKVTGVCCLTTPKPNGCKDLHEPRDSTPVTRQLLAALRRATTQLGQAWRYSQAERSPWHEDASEDTSSQTTSSDEPALMHFVILSPGCKAAHVTLRHALPATLDEVIVQLQSERDALSKHRFPTVVPATPQPCPGSGVVIAIPEWCNDDLPGASCFVCLDLSAYEGRLLVSSSPAYVSRRHLLHLADLPLDSDVAVHMKDDFRPMPDGTQFHVAMGDTFLFLPPGSVVPTLYTLAQELLTRDAWSRTLTVPFAASEDNFCLVHENETVLFQPSVGSPMQLHSQIAACIGSNRQFLRLFPANPRVDDAALRGVPCRGVISVCVPTGPLPAPFHGVLVDARGLLAGWRTYHAVAGRFSCNRALTELQHDLPSGWRATFANVPLGVDLIDSTPGQVLIALAERIVATFSLRSPNSAAGEAPTAANEPIVPSLSAGGGGPSTSGSLADPGHLDAGSVEATIDRAPPSARATAAERNYHVCVFLVLGQNYLPELIEVRLPEDIEVEHALAIVSAARNPRDTFALPHLCAINPQPRSTHALLLAAPAWPFSGTLVAFDWYIGGSVFTLHLHGRLRAARLDEHFQGEVYVGSLPWPLVDDVAINLELGDLVLFHPPRARHHIVASLADMLRCTREWRSDYDPTEDFPTLPGHHAWIIGDQDSFLFHIQSDRRQLFRADVSRLLSATGEGVLLQLAQPPVNDFAYRGVQAHAIFAASQARHHAGTSQDGKETCFIDACPLLLTFSGVPCPSGVLDTAQIVLRYSPRCPAGWELGLFRSDLRRLPLGPRIEVEPGEVLVVCCCPIRRGLDSPLPPPDDDQDDDAVDHDSDGEASHPSGDPTLVQGHPPDAPPDTGGTGPPSQCGHGSRASPYVEQFPESASSTKAASLHRHSRRKRRSVHSDVHHCLLILGLLMWRVGFHAHDARPAGTLLPTPVLPRPFSQPALARLFPDRLPEVAPETGLMTSFKPLPAWLRPQHLFGSGSLRLIRPVTALVATLALWILGGDALTRCPHVNNGRSTSHNPHGPMHILSRGGRLCTLCSIVFARGGAAVHLGGGSSLNKMPEDNPVSSQLASHLQCSPFGEGRPWVLEVDAPALRPRTVPTPCRSLSGRVPTPRPNLPPPSSDHRLLESFGPLTTLLDEAAAASDEWAFLAATLLETLFEHAETLKKDSVETTPGMCSACSAQPLALDQLLFAGGDMLDRGHDLVPGEPLSTRLASHVGDAHGTLRIGLTSLHFSWQDIFTFLGATPNLEPLASLRSSFQGPQTPCWDALYRYLVERHPAHSGAAEAAAIQCYTDGSFTPASGDTSCLLGWAVLFYLPDTADLLCAWGAVPPELLGPPLQASAYVAECYALLVAALLCVNRFNHVCAHFLSDCQSALTVVAGHSTCALGGLAEAAANMHTLRRMSSDAPDVYEYVPGHSGVAPNEAADFLSKRGAHSPQGSCGLQVSQDTMIAWLSGGAPRVPWAGVAIRSVSGDAAYPPLNSQHLGDDNFHGSLSLVDLIRPFAPLGAVSTPADSGSTTSRPAEGSCHQCVTMRLTVATYNTLSLLGEVERDSAMPHEPPSKKHSRARSDSRSHS